MLDFCGANVKTLRFQFLTAHQTFARKSIESRLFFESHKSDLLINWRLIDF